MQAREEKHKNSTGDLPFTFDQHQNRYTREQREDEKRKVHHVSIASSVVAPNIHHVNDGETSFPVI